MRILSLAGMTFLLEQSLENEVGSMVLEEVLPLSSSGADAPALAVSERMQALEKNVSRGTGRRGGRGGGSLGPRQRSGIESLDGVQSQILAELRAMGSRLGKWTNRLTALCQRGCNSRTEFPWSPCQAFGRRFFNCSGSRFGPERYWENSASSVFSSSRAADGASPLPLWVRLLTLHRHLH